MYPQFGRFWLMLSPWWEIGQFGKQEKGFKFYVGLDPWVGCGGNFKLIIHMILNLKYREIVTLSQVDDHDNKTIWQHAWMNGRDLGFNDEDNEIWEICTEKLHTISIRIKDEDSFLW